MKRVLLVTIALGAALVAGVGCGGGEGGEGGGGESATSQPRTKAIRIEDFLYKPSPAVVRAGTRVSIENADGAPHTLTDRGAQRRFDSGTIRGGTAGAVTVATPGTYTYFCEFHPTMRGELRVAE